MVRPTIPIAPAATSCASAPACSSGACTSGGCGGESSGEDPQQRLRRDGWVLRTTIGEPRLSEIAQAYREMGYEVHIEHFATPAGNAGGETCSQCFEAGAGSPATQLWGAVYVRRSVAQTADGARG